MNTWKQVESVRYLIERSIDVDHVCPIRSVNEPNIPEDGLMEVLRLSHQGYQIGQAAMRSGRYFYFDDIRRNQESAGRIVDIAMPVQWSGGIDDLATLLEKVKSSLDEVLSELDTASQKAKFGTGCVYDESARRALVTICDQVSNRALLYIRAHLWCLWALEAVRQLGRIYTQFTDSKVDKKWDSIQFPYIAHPPILVSTLSTAASVEEVGAEYINKYTSDHVDPDKTNLSTVLTLLEEHCPNTDSFDLEKIGKFVKTPRNNLAHYLSKRDSVNIDNTEDFVEAIMECSMMIREIVEIMLMDALQAYEQIPLPDAFDGRGNSTFQ